MRRICHILVVLTGIVFQACEGLHSDRSSEATVSHVDISVSTKAGALDTDEGDAFENLLIVLADKNFTVKKTPVYIEYDECLERDVVSIENVEIGDYIAFAYANIDNSAWQDGLIALNEKGLAVGQTIDPDRLMKSLGAGEQPSTLRTNGSKAVSDGSMLLTGYNNISVGVTTNSVSVDLLRPVCRLNVYVNNHSESDIELSDLSFSNFAASKSYLLDHRTPDGIPGIPAGNSYGPLPKLTGPKIIAHDGTDCLVYSVLLYENNAPIEYKIYGTVKLGSEEQIIHSIPGARLLTYDELAGMDVGESKTVLMCNPSTNNGTGRFFGSNGTGLVNVLPSSKSKEAFQEYAVYSILNNDSQRDNFLLTLTKHADNNYSLKHSGSGYNIMSVVNDGPNKEIDWKLKDEASGNFVFKPGFTSDSNILNSFADNVVLIKNNITNPYKLLQNKGDGTLKDSQENTGQKESHITQWVFYEAYDLGKEGDLLKLVDNQTSKVSPVPAMLRNSELNVVLNVYYHNAPGSFEFKVDNAYWGDNGHTIEHIFK